MKAAVYPGAGAPLAIETLPDPEPGPGEMVIRVHRCGICGTDLHMTEGHAFGFAPGTVPGHEYAGEVVALGQGVSGWKVGDRLTAMPSTGCGHCLACQRGNYVLCPAGPGYMGGFAQFMRVPASGAVRLPQALSFADGALVEPLAVGRYGVAQAGELAGKRVLVLGAGSVALTAMWWARRLEAGRVIAASRSPRRVALACAMGADDFVAFGPDEQGEVAEALGGAPQVVFECGGNPGFLGQAVRHLDRFGEIVSMGFCTAPDVLVPAAAAMKAATLRFAVGYRLDDFHAAVAELERGVVPDPAMLVTSTIALDGLPAMMASLRGANVETKVQVAP